MLELGPCPYISKFTPTHVQTSARLPDHLRLSLVSMTLSHRVDRTRNPGWKVLVESYCRYRGIILRSLSEDIDAEHKHESDLVIPRVVIILLADVSRFIVKHKVSSAILSHVWPQAQQGTTPTWRCHLEAIQRFSDSARWHACISRVQKLTFAPSLLREVRTYVAFYKAKEFQSSEALHPRHRN